MMVDKMGVDKMVSRQSGMTVSQLLSAGHCSDVCTAGDTGGCHREYHKPLESVCKVRFFGL